MTNDSPLPEDQKFCHFLKIIFFRGLTFDAISQEDKWALAVEHERMEKRKQADEHVEELKRKRKEHEAHESDREEVHVRKD